MSTKPANTYTVTDHEGAEWVIDADMALTGEHGWLELRNQGHVSVLVALLWRPRFVEVTPNVN